MNQPTSSPSPDARNTIEVDGCTIHLKNPYLAAFLGYLIPGAGHFYQGRTNKAYLYAVCILGLFFFGLYLGDGRVVYSSWTKDDFRVQFPAQACVGIPAFPALVQAYIHRNDDVGNYRRNDFSHIGPAASESEEGWQFSKWMAPPENLGELSKWNLEGSASFELGTLFTAVAGLLNILAIFDAYSGPMPMPQSPQRRKS